MENLSVAEVEDQIQQALLRDRYRLRRWWRSLHRGPTGRAAGPEQVRFFQQLRSSCDLHTARRLDPPRLVWDDRLPITAHRSEIAAAIKSHPVVIVCGETGSGKSTQLPKICLELGRGSAGYIGHTQPRRIAARSIAARLSDELGSPLGQHAGFKIRFQDTVSELCRVKVMTDGILLAETASDRFMEQYDTIIIDEAHERSLNVDFILGYLLKILPRRPELRVIVTSATLDAERFAAYFQRGDRPVPLIQVAGRGYPVETRYRPLVTSEGLAVIDDPPQDADWDEALPGGVASALEELFREGPGDVLVFLPTERAIRNVARYLRGWSLHHRQICDILPLYARLSLAEQNRVFQVSAQRRVVLSTNVAESSLTVPGIRYVVDAGTARVSRYAPRQQVQRLPVERISQASADQRQGRCGREAPGLCIRLYTEEDYLSRDRFGLPEIRRTNLAAVLLRMLSLRLGDIHQFPFLDAPRHDAVRDAYQTLQELEAIDSEGRLSALGREMSRLPVDPRIARIIIAGRAQDCLQEILILAAALETQDPRLRPAQREMLADEQHARFQHPDSDFMGYLSLWDHFHQMKLERSRHQLKKALAQQFLSFPRLIEWQEVYRQLKSMVVERGWRLPARRDEYDSIHRALATGLLSYLAVRKNRTEYELAGGGNGFIWPGAGPLATRPACLIAAEMIETSRRYLRCVARVETEWIEEVAGHLVEREYSDPRWSRKLGTVTALERVRLRRVQLAARRASNYGRIDPGTARHLFIQHALVEENFRGHFDFFIRNRALVQSLASLAARSRNAAFVVPSALLYAFYDERLPEHVFDTGSLQRWIKRHPTSAAELIMRREDLLPDGSDLSPDLSAFPSHIQAGAEQLQITYRFDPERDDDGLSATVTLEGLARLDDDLADWLVPGMLREKIVCLIRSLPKPLRRNLIPAPDVAARAASLVTFGQGPFLATVAAALSQLGGQTVCVSDFELERLPDYLQLHIRVVDDEGKLLARGRRAAELRQRLDVPDRPALHFTDHPAWHRDALRTWDFGDLPTELRITQPGGYTYGFPALVDTGESAALRVFHQESLARQRHRSGVRRLLVLAAQDQIRAQIAWLPALHTWEQLYATIDPQHSLHSLLEDLLAESAFLNEQPIPMTCPAFEQVLSEGRERIPEAVQDIASLLPKILGPCVKLRQQVAALPDRWSDLREEALAHLERLLGPGFLVETPWEWLLQFPRYLQALALRLERIRGGGGQRDRELCAVWWEWMNRYVDRRQEHDQRGRVDPELMHYRWMLEEFRVSLFAQELGTQFKISPQRLEKQWEKVAY